MMQPLLQYHDQGANQKTFTNISRSPEPNDT